MHRIICFLRREKLLAAMIALAVISLLITADKAAALAGSLGYIDLRVISLLFCLMAVMAGYRSCGIFDAVCRAITAKSDNSKNVSLLLTAVCFFASMLITNDVALLTLVPLTITIWGGSDEKALAQLIVMETIAANLGSMVTPVGNPQSLFLYYYYQLGIGQYLQIMLPLGLLSFVLIMLILLRKQDLPCKIKPNISKTQLNKPAAIRCTVIFVICLLSVAHLLPYWLCLLLTGGWFYLSDRAVLRRVDYSLLGIFVCFFIIVGNISQSDQLAAALSTLINGRETLMGALVSQVISNVPAAILLAPFSDNAAKLLIGVNIGGLGTLVASLASLISFRLYGCRNSARKGYYLLYFSALNFALLAVLLAAATLLP